MSTYAPSDRPVHAGVAGDRGDRRASVEENNVRSVGTARRIDQLGRVVVPAELRKILGIHKGDLLDIHVEEGRLVLLKIEPECVICGRVDNLRQLHAKHVCKDCASELNPV
jgi:AbrB family transcriptional regulator, transcriptional pleiotropic regulator of transition state genes